MFKNFLNKPSEEYFSHNTFLLTFLLPMHMLLHSFNSLFVLITQLYEYSNKFAKFCQFSLYFFWYHWCNFTVLTFLLFECDRLFDPFDKRADMQQFNAMFITEKNIAFLMARRFSLPVDLTLIGVWQTINHLLDWAIIVYIPRFAIHCPGTFVIILCTLLSYSQNTISLHFNISDWCLPDHWPPLSQLSLENLTMEWFCSLIRRLSRKSSRKYIPWWSKYRSKNGTSRSARFHTIAKTKKQKTGKVQCCNTDNRCDWK